jgi:hypothetical protein
MVKDKGGIKKHLATCARKFKRNAETFTGAVSNRESIIDVKTSEIQNNITIQNKQCYVPVS